MQNAAKEFDQNYSFQEIVIYIFFSLLRCGGIFTNHFIANCPVSVPVKEF